MWDRLESALQPDLFSAPPAAVNADGSTATLSFAQAPTTDAALMALFSAGYKTSQSDS